MARHVGMSSSTVKAKSIKVNRFYVSSVEMPNGDSYVSVVDTHVHSHVYYRIDSGPQAHEFVKDYAKSLNASYKFMPEPYGNIIGGSGI
jgi:hypothetical protein